MLCLLQVALRWEGLSPSRAPSARWPVASAWEAPASRQVLAGRLAPSCPEGRNWPPRVLQPMPHCVGEAPLTFPSSPRLPCLSPGFSHMLYYVEELFGRTLLQCCRPLLAWLLCLGRRRCAGSLICFVPSFRLPFLPFFRFLFLPVRENGASATGKARWVYARAGFSIVYHSFALSPRYNNVACSALIP